MSEALNPLLVSANPRAGGSKRKFLVLALVVVLLLGGAYWAFLKPSRGETAPEPGEIMVLEPVQLNLAAGRYLRVGLAMQLTAEVEEVDGSKALDAMITLFSGLPISTVEKPEDRDRLKGELQVDLLERYDGEVMEVYFTEFVTQ